MQPYARQGDVLIFKIDRIPRDAQPLVREGGKVVLAHGETSGHCHAILDDPARSATLFGRDEMAELADRFLRVEREVEVVHVDVRTGALTGEHGTVVLGPGDYQVRRQREHVPGLVREPVRLVSD